MMSSWQPDQIVIDRMRVKSSRLDALTGQLRITNLLRTAPPNYPTGLKPFSVLVIRKLRDPLPRSLPLQQTDNQVPQTWQTALTASLDRLVRGAARPALGPVPANAEAVVFLDRSELLACLASDWCERSVATRWWWQSLLKQGTAFQIVKDLWRRDPEYVPAALQQLANKNKAADFVRALSDDEVHQLLRGVARSFALHSLISVSDVFASLTNVQHESRDINEVETFRKPETDEQSRARPEGPWRPWVPESAAPGLRPEQELFLGIALMLQRAPIKVRAAVFQTQVRQWQQEIAIARKHGSFNLSNTPDTPPATERKQRSAVAVVEQLAGSPQSQSLASPQTASQVSAEIVSPSAVLQEPTVTDAVSPAPARLETSAAVEVDDTRVRKLRSKSAPKQAQRRRKPSQLKQEVAGSLSVVEKNPSAPTTHKNRQPIDSQEPTRRSPQKSPQTRAHVEAPPTSSHEVFSTAEASTPQVLDAVTADYQETEELVETELGGLFYLINLGLFLNLYGDFTTPDEPGLQLNIWDFVALLGRELVGKVVQDDPVWPLLARLANREEDEPPGCSFNPDDEWPVANSEFGVWSLEFGVPGSHSSTVAASGNERETPNSKLQTPKSEPQTSSAIAVWLDRLLPEVRTRLRQALGLTEDDDPGPFVCRRWARVCVTPTHVDLFFNLAELPIEIRLAGLDRNPGWVPAAGRFITFHYD